MAEVINSKRKYYARSFLNPEKGLAAIEATTFYWHENCVSSCFRISDCNRVVALDFDWDTAEQRQQKLEKLDMLMAELSKFKEDLLIAN